MKDQGGYVHYTDAMKNDEQSDDQEKDQPEKKDLYGDISISNEIAIQQARQTMQLALTARLAQQALTDNDIDLTKIKELMNFITNPGDLNEEIKG